MKIGEYEQMMSYLTRPDTRTKLAGGTNPETGQGFQKGNTIGKKENVIKRNKEANKLKLERVNRFKKLVKEGKTPNEAKKIVIDEFNLNRDPKAGTPKWMTQGKAELVEEGIEFKESKRGPENVGGKEKAKQKRKQVIGKEAEQFESRLKKEKTTTGLGKKFETAHTANIFQAKKLGMDYPIDALAIQATKINQEIAEVLNDELKPLYKKQIEIRNKLEKNNTFALRKELDELNLEISDTVATGGKQGSKAANVLKPIIVDPKTLEGKILDLGFKTSDEVMTVPGSTTKGTKAGTIEDLMARMNVKENVLQKAKNLKTPKKTKEREMFKKAFKGQEGFIDADLLKDAGKFGKYTLQVAGTPLGVVGLTAGLGVDPTSSIDRSALAAEAALAPALVKGTDAVTKNAALKKLLNLGMSPKMAMRAARIASPLGIASLGGEALYQYGKFAKGEIEKLKNMEPDERKAYTEALMDEGGLLD